MIFELEETVTQNARMKVVGVGGGGGNALNRMIDEHVSGVEFISVNTDMNSTPLTRSEEHTSELQSQSNLVCRLLLEKKKKNTLQFDAHQLTHLDGIVVHNQPVPHSS